MEVVVTVFKIRGWTVAMRKDKCQILFEAIACRMIEVADDNWYTFDRRGACCGPGTYRKCYLACHILENLPNGTGAPIFTYSESARERKYFGEMKNENRHVRD